MARPQNWLDNSLLIFLIVMAVAMAGLIAVNLVLLGMIIYIASIIIVLITISRAERLSRTQFTSSIKDEKITATLHAKLYISKSGLKQLQDPREISKNFKKVIVVVTDRHIYLRPVLGYIDQKIRAIKKEDLLDISIISKVMTRLRTRHQFVTLKTGNEEILLLLDENVDYSLEAIIYEMKSKEPAS